MLLSIVCLADGAWVREDEGGDCWVGEVKQGCQIPSLFIRYCAAFKNAEHFACTHPELYVALIGYSSTNNIVGANN